MRRTGIHFVILVLAVVPASLAEDAVYLWRMQNTPALESAVRGEKQSPLLALAAEVSVKSGAPIVRRAASAGVARKAGASFTPVVRAGRPPGVFATGNALLATLETEAVRAAAMNPANTVQLDFDCPQSKLADYATFVSGIKTRHPGLRVTVTGMPCWLGEPDLEKLLTATDGWTLQLHMTDLPANAAKLPALCDVARSRAWIKKASATGHAFRVALPTYAYLAHFDAGGKFLGVEAEMPRERIPGDSLVTWAPDYAALAALVKELHDTPSPGFSGIDWFRLPCADDSLNLTPAAFAKLRTGVAPDPGKIEARAIRSADDAHVVDLFLVNTGELDAVAPSCLVAHAPRPQFNDLPGATRMDYQKPDTLTVFPAPARLRPGERRRLGWMRFADPIIPAFSSDTGASPLAPSPAAILPR